MMARAMTARCFCPPDRSPGQLAEEALDRAQADPLERVAHQLAGSPRRSATPWMRSGCASAVSRSIDGVEGGVRILEDHLDLASQRPELPLGQLGDLLAAVADAPAGGGDQAHQRPAQGGLAAARLADDSEHLTAAAGRSSRRRRP